MRRLLVHAVALLAAAATVRAQSLVDPRLRAVVVAEGLGIGQPRLASGFTFLGDGVVLAVGRLDGKVFRIDLPDAGADEPGDPLPPAMPGAVVLDLDIVAPWVLDYQSEYGVQAIERRAAPSPSPETGEPIPAAGEWIYLRYDQSVVPGLDTRQQDLEKGAVTQNVIERYLWDPAANEGQGALVFDRLIASVPFDSRYHHGGPIVFGPDNMLYTAYGDLRRAVVNLAGNTPGGEVNWQGVIVRLTADGDVPPDNPFVSPSAPDAGAAPAGTEAWFAYGVRNCFGLDFEPQSGALWISDNGEGRFDEINIVRPGDNLGWRAVAGPSTHPLQQGDPAALFSLAGAVYREPLFSWLDTIGVTGVHFLRGSALGPEFDHLLIAGGFNHFYLWALPVGPHSDSFAFSTPALQDLVDDRENTQVHPAGSEAEEIFFGDGFGSIFGGVVAIERGPDRRIYILTAQGEIIRVDRKPGFCRSDVSNDGVVDVFDISTVIGAWGQAGLGGPADVDADGVVNSTDLGYVLSDWGPC